MNTVVRRGPVATFFVTLWNVINFTRQFILNILFFGFLLLCAIFVLVAMAHGGGGVQALQDRTTLVIAPEGKLVEQYSADPVSARAGQQAVGRQRAPTRCSCATCIRAIEAARDGQEASNASCPAAGQAAAQSGFASMREVVAARAATCVPRASRWWPSASNMSQSQYLLAAQANEVYRGPDGRRRGAGRPRHVTASTSAPALAGQAAAWTCIVFKVGDLQVRRRAVRARCGSPAQAKDRGSVLDDRCVAALPGRHRQGTQARCRPRSLAAGIDTMPEGIAAAGGDLGASSPCSRSWSMA